MNELPSYPTPRQASYNPVPHSSEPSVRKKPNHANVTYKPPPPSQYNPNYGYQQYAQPPVHQQPQSYQQPTGYYQQPPPPPPQSHYHAQPPPPPPQQNSYYSQPNNLGAAPTPQQAYYSQQQQVSPQPVQPVQPAPPSQRVQPPHQGYRSQSGSAAANVPNDVQHQRYEQPPAKKPPTIRKDSFQDNVSAKSTSSKHKLEGELRSVFDRVDTNRSGRISRSELQNALLNFDHTKFQDSTITLMINLFGTPNTNAKHLNFDQFVSLWKYLTAYKKLFVQADSNNSGNISFGEFQKVLEQIGYKLNIDLVLHLFQKFSYKDVDGADIGKLKFDRFIELLVYLRKLTDIFKKYDKDLSGVATINFLDFLFEVSNLN